MKRFVLTKSTMTARAIIIGAVMSLMLPLAASYAQKADSNSALMARQQMRLNTIEDNLKTVRGTLETEFRAIRMQIEELVESSVEEDRLQAEKIKSLRAQISELGDTLDIFNQRLRRSIELSSDIEFRVLRMEKRMQTLLSLSGDAVTDAILQEGVTAGGTAPAVSMSRDNDTGGATWTVEKDDDLKAELAKNDNSSTDNQSEALATNTSVANDNGATTALSANDNGSDNSTLVGQADEVANTDAQTDSQTDSQADAQTDSEIEVAEEEAVSVLPDASPEEQYRFAFGRMLQNDLETAEAGFTEFRAAHQDHERSADVLYWLGRVQFIQGDYGKSAMSFTEFNSEFPEDSRLPEAILMIAESVLNFATTEQACQIFADLPQMLDQPSEIFITRLGELKTKAACEG